MKAPLKKTDPKILELDYFIADLKKNIAELTEKLGDHIIHRNTLLTPYEIGDRVRLPNGREYEITAICSDTIFPLRGRQILVNGKLGTREMIMYEDDITETLLSANTGRGGKP